MNFNYLGSLSQRKIKFQSTVDVIVQERNELFNAISVYVPASLASNNIIDYDPAWATAKKPAVMTCDVNNYKTIMKGKLLDQWEIAFRQDTNIDLVVYLIVFLDDATTATLWHMDDANISFDPLSEAFKRLYFISYFKVLFDETCDGEPTIIPDPGTRSTADIDLFNATMLPVLVQQGTYSFNDGVVDWDIVVENDTTVAAGSSENFIIRSATVGDDAVLATGTLTAPITPLFPIGIDVNVNAVTLGTNPGTSPTSVPSKFFDLSLALALLCRGDRQLSVFISLVRVTLPLEDPDVNRCLIASKNTIEGQTEFMQSIQNDDREKYYWGALYLMRCTNTWVLVHSESAYIITNILAEWMAGRNSSGQFVGNKLSLIRLSGSTIKPFGVPSWLNGAVNENYTDAFAGFDELCVGFLASIADNTLQDSCLSSARCVPDGLKKGFPVNALMISKFVDYASSQDVAKLITDKGTLVNPVLTDEYAYNRIQEIFKANLSKFVPTRRIVNIQMKFPSFTLAKTGLTELTMASAWEAIYVDDLDKVTVIGGIVEEA